ncbi:DUF1566 domain-containing protein [Legionella donaldsonii]|uniref:Lcl domain-containing protein n=1 Tax=Legionella donaldsonii TaxID=45060 RepID=UPI00399CD8F6
MNKKLTMVGIGIVSAVSLTTAVYGANPASTQYVDQKVQQAVSQLESQIASISGTPGPQGPQGPQGPSGVGIPAGGTTGQLLAKVTNLNYDTQWIDGPVTYAVGQQTMGGVVFWVDSSGQHGLIAASADNEGGGTVTWRNSTDVLTRAISDGIYGGRPNTGQIMALQVPDGNNIFAARVCYNYAIQADGTSACADPGAAGATCYADWYLPSRFELNQLYLQRAAVGGFTTNSYWSSTESSASDAWAQSFTNGSQSFPLKDSLMQVRCIRAF